jgi:hypothetical protein
MAERMRTGALVAEALRVNGRYLEEVVVGWGLCPWAEGALRAGQVRRRVLLDVAPPPEAVLPFVRELEAAPEVAVGLVIFPRADLSPSAFDGFAERVRRAQRDVLGQRRAELLVAAFHPAAPADASTPARLVSYLRRTPDPTLQLVRASIIERASGAGGGRDPSAEVARANFATVTARGPAALEAVLQAIRRDRDDSYARLG